MTNFYHHPAHAAPADISDIFERFPPDSQIRKQFHPETFSKILETHNKPLVETYHNFMRGITESLMIKAKIAIEGSSPLSWRFAAHKGGLPAGVKNWKGMSLGDFEDNWERHFTRCAFEYRDAVDEGKLVCHQITQRIEYVERSYHRLIYPADGHVLVASSLLYLRAEPGSYEEFPADMSNA